MKILKKISLSFEIIKNSEFITIFTSLRFVDIQLSFEFPQDRYRLFMYTLDDTNKKLKRILNLLDWSKGFDVSSVCQRHLPAILQIIEKKRLPVVHSFMLNFHYLPKEEALLFDTK